MRLIILFLGIFLTGCATTQNFIETAAITESRLTSPAVAKFSAQSQKTIDHSVFDQFLNTYLVAPSHNDAPSYGAALLRYADVSPADKDALTAYISRLQSVQLSSFNQDEQLAFWINLYNAQTIRTILDNYPVNSIRAIKTHVFDFKGPWNDASLTIEDETLTLDKIENGIIRPIFNDPRIHYALNCAAIGCPNLRAQSYKGVGINRALDTQARTFINNPRAIKVEDGRIIASRIFLWYKEDYGDSEEDILRHIRQYANPALLHSLQGVTNIDTYEYDWALNVYDP